MRGRVERKGAKTEGVEWCNELFSRQYATILRLISVVLQELTLTQCIHPRLSASHVPKLSLPAQDPPYLPSGHSDPSE